MTPKQKFIGEYLEEKFKDCTLPYGMAYYSKLESLTEEAEKMWKEKLKKNHNRR